MRASADASPAARSPGSLPRIAAYVSSQPPSCQRDEQERDHEREPCLPRQRRRAEDDTARARAELLAARKACQREGDAERAETRRGTPQSPIEVRFGGRRGTRRSGRIFAPECLASAIVERLRLVRDRLLDGRRRGERARALMDGREDQRQRSDDQPGAGNPWSAPFASRGRCAFDRREVPQLSLHNRDRPLEKRPPGCTSGATSSFLPVASDDGVGRPAEAVVRFRSYRKPAEPATSEGPASMTAGEAAWHRRAAMPFAYSASENGRGAPRRCLRPVLQ